VRLRPTRLGWKAIALFVVLQLAFFATSYNNLFFLVLAFSVVLFAVGALRGVQHAQRLAAQLGAVPLAAAGAPRRLEVRVTGPSLGGDVGAALWLAPVGAPARAVPFGSTALQAGVATLAAELPPQPRGVVPIGQLRVRTTYPFGLLRCERRLASTGELATFPAPREGAAVRLFGSSDDELAAAGAVRSNVAAGLRPYRQGDELRDVHWKASARRGAPVVREWEPERGDATTVVVDRRLDGDAFELALAEAAGLVLAAGEHDADVELVSQGVQFRIGRSARDRDAALRWLAAAQPVADGNAPELPAIALPRNRRLLQLPVARGGRRG
jgi:uncharacterized protein (DUF58 family)